MLCGFSHAGWGSFMTHVSVWRVIFGKFETRRASGHGGDPRTRVKTWGSLGVGGWDESLGIGGLGVRCRYLSLEFLHNGHIRREVLLVKVLDRREAQERPLLPPLVLRWCPRGDLPPLLPLLRVVTDEATRCRVGSMAGGSGAGAECVPGGEKEGALKQTQRHDRPRHDMLIHHANRKTPLAREGRCSHRKTPLAREVKRPHRWFWGEDLGFGGRGGVKEHGMRRLRQHVVHLPCSSGIIV